MKWPILCACVLLAACAPSQRVRQTPSAPATAPTTPRRTDTFLDLQPGWRLQAVMGLRADGSVARPQLLTTQQDGLNLTLSMPVEVVGFATDIYAISPRMRLDFAASERRVEGQSKPSTQPALPLFANTPRLRHLRLLYLLQASANNHNMALLAAANPTEMDALTQRVEANPDKACLHSPRAHCQWIPPGVALRAEKPGPQPNTFIPAR
jgi:hypothetical protein